MAWALALGALGKDLDFAAAFVIFFVLLPVLNAAVDFISWLVTRELGRRLLGLVRAGAGAGTRAFAVVSHTVADFVLALALLLALAWLLGFFFEAYGLSGWMPGIAAQDHSWARGWLVPAIQVPFGAGLWITLMLASTLVPTAIHLAFMSFSGLAIVTLPDEPRQALLARLEGWSYASEDERKTTVPKVASYFARDRIFLWAAAIFCSGAVLGLLGVAVALLLRGTGIGSFSALVLWAANLGIATAHDLLVLVAR